MGGWRGLFWTASERCLRVTGSWFFGAPWILFVSNHEYLHRPCLHPGQKRRNPAGEELTSEALYCSTSTCMEKAEDFKDVVKLKRKIIKIWSKQANFSFFFFLLLLIILFSMYIFLQLATSQFSSLPWEDIAKLVCSVCSVTFVSRTPAMDVSGSLVFHNRAIMC